MRAASGRRRQPCLWLPRGLFIAVLATGLLVIGLAALARAEVMAQSPGRLVADIERVQIDRPLAGGALYRLPSIGLTNAGSAPQQYEARLAPGGATLPPAEWVRLAPDRFELSPGGTRSVRVHLDLPADAEPGAYAALIEVAATDGTPGSLVRLDFSVAAGGGDGRFAAVRAWAGDIPVWVSVLGVTLLMAAVLSGARRRVRALREHRS